MRKHKIPPLTRRERQIMDVLYRLERGTAADILNGLPDQPNYSTVRALLRILEDKGHVRHVEEGVRYVFSPTVAPEAARRSALRHLVETFFGGSTEQAVATLVADDVSRLTTEELDRLAQMIEDARQKGAQ